MTEIDPDILSAEDKAKAINVVKIIKKKKDGSLKGRIFYDGSKKKMYLGKNESVVLPTVSLKSLFATLVIDAYEERDIATFNIPGA